MISGEEIIKVGNFSRIYQKITTIDIGFLKFYKIVESSNIDIWDFVLDPWLFEPKDIDGLFSNEDVLYFREVVNLLKKEQELHNNTLKNKLSIVEHLFDDKIFFNKIVRRLVHKELVNL